MNYTSIFGIREGDIIAIVGCNGKTSLLYALADENRAGKVLLSTTTHIYMPEKTRFDRVTDGGRLTPGINLAYGGMRDGKLYGLKEAELMAICPDDGITLIECDGSRGLPFKGYNEYEPPVPAFATMTIGVCALWQVGLPFTDERVLRPKQFSLLTGAVYGEPVTIKHVAAMISEPMGMFKNSIAKRALLINQNADDMREAHELIGSLPKKFMESLSIIAQADLKHEKNGEVLWKSDR